MDTPHPSTGAPIPPDQTDALTGNLFFYGDYEDIYKVTVYEPAGASSAIPETLIHSIWKYQQFDHEALVSTQGDLLKVLRIGVYNKDEGPDFLNAAIEIDGTLWYGDVELHRTSSDWFTHRHHENTRYNSTVLHVTLFEDAATGTLKRQDQSLIPELVLSTRLKASLRSLLYMHRTTSSEPLPCSPFQTLVKPDSTTPWLLELGNNRVLRKKKNIEDIFLTTPDLEHILQVLLFTGLGYAKNCDPMAALAARTPAQLVRSLGSEEEIEALHFGVSGLIPTREELIQTDKTTMDYAGALRSRFESLNAPLQLMPLPRTSWQFFRLRPANFPPRRIAQAAALYFKDGILSKNGLETAIQIMKDQKPAGASVALSALLQRPASSFWQTHYQFKPKKTAIDDPLSANTPHIIGKTRVNKLILNAICPVMLVYADQTQNPSLERAVFELIAHLRAERDHVVKCFSDLNVNTRSALYSQGLHELHEHFCKKGKCTSCKVGISIINNNLDHQI